ncbi:potassium-transporting ATPase subunit C [Leptospira ognonensis]|uniref:Potassium-transporting ATPase subunit C n=1 Tax=Leptospira ognonensis TaxID=2484945 RepID=A0A4R9KCT9_9LEPT|nr:potassium-transporting ATPase subunit C [Leptospira ognonensis]TGL63926.1 potassium-transporting ATPase subunit C [Leptospira ognonensis]
MNQKNNVGDVVIGIRLLALSLFVLAGIYPILITLYATVFFSEKAKGNMFGETAYGMASKNISQDFSSKGWFQSRPSSSNYNTLPSGASNLSRTSRTLHDQVIKREISLQAQGIDPKKCPELLYTSGSGIDPHITPICALEQANRIVTKFGISKEALATLITQNTESSLLGILGRDRVNVVSLNLDLRKLLNVK